MRLVIVAGLFTLGVMGWMQVRVSSLDAQVSALEELIMDKLSLTWRSTNGTHVIETVQRAGETDEQHEARHNARVARQQAIYPPITQ